MILYYQGQFPSHQEIIAIIGPRGPISGSRGETMQHQRDCSMAYNLARQAARKGIVILSGLASGIDTAAHQGCLDEGGATVAVVPFGLSAKVYPTENEKLAKNIINSGGCLISQFAPDQPAVKWTFVSRDKTQAMLSDKVIVVGTFPPDGIITGGTKYCAKWARKLGKPLYHYRQIDDNYAVFMDQEVLIQK